MRIACFFPQSLYSAWSVSEGLVDTLRRMGHEPVACPIDPNTKSLSRSQYPSLEQLNECDGVLVSGPEHINKFLTALYPKWNDVKVPMVAWWHETVERSDYGMLDYKRTNARYSKVFTPAAQDEQYGMTHLPFGVDVDMFHPICGDDRKYGAIFVGLVYGPRAEFVTKHRLHEVIQAGKCEVTDFDGVNVRKSCELYAATLRDAKILVNLPSLCRHAVTKIFEGPACGAVMLTHKVEDERNHVLRSAMYYENGDELRDAVVALLENDSLRMEKAIKQCEEIHEHHRLDQRLEVILRAMR